MSEEKKITDYRDTLLLPETDLPMKAKLPENEPKLLDKWNEIGTYAAIRKSSEGKDKFILHDGPPYANGNLHMGTALNKILKDIEGSECEIKVPVTEEGALYGSVGDRKSVV